MDTLEIALKNIKEKYLNQYVKFDDMYMFVKNIWYSRVADSVVFEGPLFYYKIDDDVDLTYFVFNMNDQYDFDYECFDKRTSEYTDRGNTMMIILHKNFTATFEEGSKSMSEFVKNNI